MCSKRRPFIGRGHGGSPEKKWFKEIWLTTNLKAVFKEECIEIMFVER